MASFTCGTDNQGNMFLLDKLLTTKYPLGVVLMELSVQLGLRRAAMRANWIPRLQNEEAAIDPGTFALRFLAELLDVCVAIAEHERAEAARRLHGC